MERHRKSPFQTELRPEQLRCVIEIDAASLKLCADRFVNAVCAAMFDLVPQRDQTILFHAPLRALLLQAVSQLPVFFCAVGGLHDLAHAFQILAISIHSFAAKKPTWSRGPCDDRGHDEQLCPGSRSPCAVEHMHGRDHCFAGLYQAHRLGGQLSLRIDFRPRREKPIQFLGACGPSGGMLRAGVHFADDVVIYRPSGSVKVAQNVLIVITAALKHRLDYGDFPAVKTISPPSPRHRVAILTCAARAAQSSRCFVVKPLTLSHGAGVIFLTVKRRKSKCGPLDPWHDRCGHRRTASHVR